MKIDNYYTIKQTSELLGITMNRVLKKIHQKKRKCFPGAVKPGHDWLIPIEEVMKELKYIRNRR